MRKREREPKETFKQALMALTGLLLFGACLTSVQRTSSCVLHPYTSRSGFSRSDYENETARQALRLTPDLCQAGQADIYIVDGNGGIIFKDQGKITVFLPSTVETRRVLGMMRVENIPKENDAYTLISASYLFHEEKHREGILDERAAWKEQINFLEGLNNNSRLVNGFLSFARTKILP